MYSLPPLPTCRVFGDMREETLAFCVVILQAVCCGVGFMVRYGGGRSMFFNEEL